MKEVTVIDALIRLAGAGAVGCIAYFLICAALRPAGWTRGSTAGLSDTERYVAIGVAVVLFLIVQYRMYAGSWGAEQVEKLLKTDTDDL